MTNALEDALADLRGEVESGCELGAAVEEIAAEHGLNSILLRRKFTERFGSVAALLEKQDLAKSSARPEIDYEKVKALVEHQCRRFRVKPDKFFPLKGKTEVTITSRMVGDHMVHVVVDFHECAVIERSRNVRDSLEMWWESARTKL
ncbi:MULTISPECIES: hypothetical protein [unclassified Mesorhizobium]|uniref:hypothetical protein n=1 Tax=unclassified Mesorhizobium TaxID=325217 RepID=UPI00112C3DAA|nr:MULTISPECIES: hypothetical protein [unclassified Mesorhizobium]TPK57417.1 hypothetical protein FJ551_29365 [Mesorhizobium sp. B2-5-1]TPM54067.1 hypothetical protein FJ962_29050 [Mesorhizobium sp. B2-1-9]TPM80454.1 hypothetical protein FJ963_26110 [Mesorhizobium sp. B2-1-4]TPN04863.1 hypothetical protein FJ971_28790 [Mesorhizobium sp. B2-1-2]UCI13144.1 hypothetical protein FJ972_26820 [Mesorhizobium sp. B2-1-1]